MTDQIDKYIWSEGKRYLVENGLTMDRAGSVIGKWRKTYAAADVSYAIRQALKHQPSHPVEYINKILSERKSKLPRDLKEYSDTDLVKNFRFWQDFYSTRAASSNRDWALGRYQAEIARRGLEI